jgi:hypothetical protein
VTYATLDRFRAVLHVLETPFGNLNQPVHSLSCIPKGAVPKSRLRHGAEDCFLIEYHGLDHANFIQEVLDFAQHIEFLDDIQKREKELPSLSVVVVVLLETGEEL